MPLTAADIAYGKALLALGAIPPDRLRTCSTACAGAGVPLRDYLARQGLVTPDVDREAVRQAQGQLASGVAAPARASGVFAVPPQPMSAPPPRASGVFAVPPSPSPAPRAPSTRAGDAEDHELTMVMDQDAAPLKPPSPGTSTTVMLAPPPSAAPAAGAADLTVRLPAPTPPPPARAVPARAGAPRSGWSPRPRRAASTRRSAAHLHSPRVAPPPAR